jgi:hypothetical protein
MLKESKFELGALLITPGARKAISYHEIFQAISRHAAGDWGDVSEEGAKLNDQALKEGGQLFSVYESSNGIRFYIITEANRNTTTVLLPDEY